MKLIFSLFCLLLVVKANDIPIICNQTGAHEDIIVDGWVSQLQSLSFSSQRLKALSNIAYNSSQGFTAAQTARLLSVFPFSSDMVEAMNMLEMHVLGMTCDEAANILRTFSFSSDQLTVLETIVSFVTDLENNSTLVNLFTFSSQRQAAQAIIDAASPRSCIYGTVNEKRVIFIVDVSYSMQASFIATNGEKFNRLTFVQRELDEVIRHQLRNDQSFNVFSFAGRVVQWQPGVVPANATNINMAVNFVRDMTFRPDGTNSYEALRVAFSDPIAEAIYFLTDGQPSVGTVTDPMKIIAAVQQWNTRNIPVHATAFLSGYFQGDNKPAARQFMSDLAEATGGIFRSIE